MTEDSKTKDDLKQKFQINQKVIVPEISLEEGTHFVVMSVDMVRDKFWYRLSINGPVRYFQIGYEDVLFPEHMIRPFYSSSVEIKPPSPGEGHRLVNVYTEEPSLGMDYWDDVEGAWKPRLSAFDKYVKGVFYRVKRDPIPEYRAPTNSDIGKMVEVKNGNDFIKRKLAGVVYQDERPCGFYCYVNDYHEAGYLWKEARISIYENPPEQVS